MAKLVNSNIREMVADAIKLRFPKMDLCEIDHWLEHKSDAEVEALAVSDQLDGAIEQLLRPNIVLN